jgi:hypothetical protein
MNHQAKIKGINSVQVRDESAIKACNPVAVLPGVPGYVAGLIEIMC